MNILYGVQATGQGHISRARALAEAFRRHDINVTWLLSGRPRDQLFDMAIFGDYEHRQGLTFVTEAGRLRYRKTAIGNNLLQFTRDVAALDLSCFDLVVTDYEPITAWAGRRQRRKVIGIGHQYAFGPKTPKAGDSIIQQTIMQRFAPVTRPVGLHWAAFDSNVLPPILDLPALTSKPSDDVILVYLPFEDQTRISQWLQSFPEHQFVQYANGISDEDRGNVGRRKANIKGFKADLARCKGVICNSGFELISECLQWHKPVLTRPLKGQMEQLSNAAALESLGYASVMDQLDEGHTRAWLDRPREAPNVHFNDVASRLAQWLTDGANDPIDILCSELWDD